MLGEDWEAALGDFGRLGEWRNLFHRELAESSWKEVLECWVPRVMSGNMAAGTHGIIRCGHAARALQHEVTALFTALGDRPGCRALPANTISTRFNLHHPISPSLSAQRARWSACRIPTTCRQRHPSSMPLLTSSRCRGLHPRRAGVHIGRTGRKSGSHRTPRRRKADSNPRSLTRRSRSSRKGKC
jgi:hypothetical protein